MRKIDVCMVAYTNYMTDARVRRAAESLASLPDYSVRVLALREGGEPATYEHAGVEVRELAIAKYQGKSQLSYFLSYLAFLLRATLAVTRLLLRRELDVVHVHNMPNFLVFSALPARLAGKKVILDVHDTMLETYTAKFIGKPNRLLVAALRLEEIASCAVAHRLVCVNQVQKQAMVDRGFADGKIAVILNVPDPRVFPASGPPAPARERAGRFRLAYHGTVARRLSVDLALQAVARLARRLPDIEFLVLGNGDDLGEFKRLARELGIADRVLFRPRVPFGELVEVLRTVDLEVISNRRSRATELMLPVKLLDCVAMGIPVVVPRLDAISHYFTDDMVFFFEPGPADVESLADAIERAYRDEAGRRQKAVNARRFLEIYGWDRHQHVLYDLYRGLLAPGSRPLPRTEASP